MPDLAPSPILSLITGQAVLGNSGVAIMARLRGNDGNLVTQGSLDTISYVVYDVQAVLDTGNRGGSGTVVTASTALTVSSVIFDSLQQNSQLWTADGPHRLGPDGTWGFNFRAILAATSFTVANSAKTHQVDVLFTPTSGQQFRVSYRVPTLRIFA